MPKDAAARIYDAGIKEIDIGFAKFHKARPEPRNKNTSGEHTRV